VNEKQARDKAKVQIAMLSKAIEEYKLDMGVYPGTAANTNVNGLTGTPSVSAELYKALFKDGYDYSMATDTAKNNWPATRATKIYLPELDPRNSKVGWVDPVTSTTPPDSVPIKDPWGNPYRYRKGTNAQNPDFDLWSVGKDNKHNTGTLNHADNRDDIRNF